MVYNIKGSGGRLHGQTAQEHLDFYGPLVLKLWRSSAGGAEGGAIEQCYDPASEKGTASPEHVPRTNCVARATCPDIIRRICEITIQGETLPSLIRLGRVFSLDSQLKPCKRNTQCLSIFFRVARRKIAMRRGGGRHRAAVDGGGRVAEGGGGGGSGQPADGEQRRRFLFGFGIDALH